MVVIFGAIIVLVAVLVGFTMAGGKVGALLHLSEVITICGAALGALIIMSPKKVLVDLVRGLVQVIKGSPYNKAACIELFGLLYAFAGMVRRDGLLALDSHITNPDASDLFKQFPLINKNNHFKHFFCDAMFIIVDGQADRAQLTASLEEEIKVVEREHHAAVTALVKIADAFPGFGIVAAVLGIVVTMQAIGGPVEEIGYKVGAALVGTFLGILLAYGFFAPMAGRLEFLGEQEVVFLRTVAVAVVEMKEGANPRDVVIRARRLVGTDCRPSQAELKQLFEGSSNA